MNAFLGATAKMNRAMDLQGEFIDELSKFANRPPVKVGVREVNEELCEIYVTQLEDWVDSALLSLSLLAGDCVHNIRAALDHFAYAVVPDADDKTTFPILRLAPRNEDEVTKKLCERGFNRADPRVSQEIKQLEAWPGGSNPLGQSLWLLHELDIVDKHRGIATTLMTSDRRTSEFGLMVGRSPFGFHFEDETRLALEAGAALWTGSGSMVDVAMATTNISFQLYFGEPLVQRAFPHARADQVLASLYDAAFEALFELMRASGR
ncbi:hypothetical protein [Modestobacter sp. URMC 112]